MDSNDLTAAQLDDLIAHVAPARDYVAKLTRRCAELQFPETDKLYTLARHTEHALDALAIDLRDLFDKAALPEWAGGKVPRIPKPRSRRARPG